VFYFAHFGLTGMVMSCKVLWCSWQRKVYELICRALGNALHRKKKNETPIFHSDRGSQYSSNRYQAMLAQNKIMGSMSKAGYPYGGSPMESFFASLKKEYFYRREYATI